MKDLNDGVKHIEIDQVQYIEVKIVFEEFNHFGVKRIHTAFRTHQWDEPWAELTLRDADTGHKLLYKHWDVESSGMEVDQNKEFYCARIQLD